MFWFFKKCIQKFGVTGGISVWMQIKLFRKETVHLPGYASPIYFRPGTADLTTFREIFLREEYKLDLPASLHPKIIIDAGANIGFTSIFLAHRYPGANIYSLEPEPSNFKLLHKNTEGYPNIKPIHAAVWPQDGILEITDRGFGLRGFMVEEAKGKGTGVSAVSIDSLIRQYAIQNIDILKMDIEGSEKEVFEGNTNWLAFTTCLVIEVHDRLKPGCSEAVFQALHPYHFSKTARGENLVFIKSQNLSC